MDVEVKQINLKASNGKPTKSGGLYLGRNFAGSFKKIFVNVKKDDQGNPLCQLSDVIEDLVIIDADVERRMNARNEQSNQTAEAEATSDEEAPAEATSEQPY